MNPLPGTGAGLACRWAALPAQSRWSTRRRLLASRRRAAGRAAGSACRWQRRGSTAHGRGGSRLTSTRRLGGCLNSCPNAGNATYACLRYLGTGPSQEVVQPGGSGGGQPGGPGSPRCLSYLVEQGVGVTARHGADAAHVWRRLTDIQALHHKHNWRAHPAAEGRRQSCGIGQQEQLLASQLQLQSRTACPALATCAVTLA
jgi:hypothetical protein